MNWPDDFINKIICGDCLEVMKEMPDESIDMTITSPPYWGLRDYGIEQIFGGDKDCEHKWDIVTGLRKATPGDLPSSKSIIASKRTSAENRPGKDSNRCLKCQAWKGQLGLEPTPEFYIEHLTEIFNEVKRVLKKEGTLWLNIGDTYWSAKGSCFNPGGGKNALESSKKEKGIYPLERGNKSDVPNLPQKCLAMIPERLAWSLIQNGWILRNKIIWYKPNAMPSSVTDRFSNRWEYIFLFSKSQRYYFDLDAVREPHATQENRPFGIVRNREWGYDSKENKLRNTKIPKDSSESYGSPRARYHRKWSGVPGQQKQSIEKHSGYYRDGECLVDFDKGKNPGDVFEIATQPFPEAHFAVFPENLCEKPLKAGCPEGGIVLDPFAGAGTALYVAKQLRRRFIGIDIKQEYCEMTEKRLAQGVL